MFQRIADGDGHLGAHPRLEAVDGLVDGNFGRVGPDVSRHPVACRGDGGHGIDLAAEGLVGERVRLDLGSLSSVDARGQRLVDLDGDEHVVEVRDLHHLLPLADRLALGDD